MILASGGSNQKRWSVHNLFWHFIPVRDYRNAGFNLSTMSFTPLVNLESMTTKPKAGTGSMESWEEHVLLFYIPKRSSRTLQWTANKARTILFYLKRSFAALSPSIPPPVKNLYPAISWICNSGSQYHPIPQRRDTGKGAEGRSEVRERASRCSVWSSPQTASSILPHTRGDLIAMFKIIHGLLEFPMTSTFAHPTAKGYAATPTNSTNRGVVHVVCSAA